MLRTALIGLAAAVALTAGATQASAKNWDVNVHFGGPGFYSPIYHPYYPIYDEGPDCYYVTKKKLVNIGGFWKKKYVKVLICD